MGQILNLFLRQRPVEDEVGVTITVSPELSITERLLLELVRSLVLSISVHRSLSRSEGSTVALVTSSLGIVTIDITEVEDLQLIDTMLVVSNVAGRTLHCHTVSARIHIHSIAQANNLSVRATGRIDALQILHECTLSACGIKSR